MSLLNKLFRFDFGYLDGNETPRLYCMETWAYEFTIKISGGPDITYLHLLSHPEDDFKRIASEIIEDNLSGETIFASCHWYPPERVSEIVFEGAKLAKRGFFEYVRGYRKYYENYDAGVVPGFSIKV